jgi:ssRNA-specific RNase YbeY (16S rRNA maturation enzyme)
MVCEKYNRRVGDIVFIFLDLVRSNARRLGVTFQQELDRIMIHGILDLCGVASRSHEEQKQRTEVEDEALMMKSAICAAKTLVRTYKEETQKYYDRYHIQKNQSNEDKD